jgi:Zn-finger nucleic acid-binding protein
MKCPVCKDVVLADAELESGLPAGRCAECGGQWVGGSTYLKWIGDRGPEPPPDREVFEAVPGEPAVRDNRKAKLCPYCGRFLTRAKVGRGLEFLLDRCGSCGGIWFDANEWEVLKGRGLHDAVHFVFSDAWQADVSRRDREAQHDRLLAQKVGEADWAEVKRVRAWLDAHPHRAELYAYLTRDVDSPAKPDAAKAGEGRV